MNLPDGERHHLVVDDFYDGAGALRSAVRRRLTPRGSPFDPARFSWELWHIPLQFAQHRTPARTFFEPSLIGAFEAHLVAWAERRLGLAALGSPPWLSFLIAGEYQGLHRDTPNGIFAFSFGLCRPGRPRFDGGETLLARPELLDYWRAGAHRSAMVHEPLFHEIASRFNRLVTFDSRVPHGVREVEGSRDPREGRIALQGWLTPDGARVLRGDLPSAQATLAAREALSTPALREATRGLEGLCTVQLDVDAKGKVTKSRELVCTLVHTDLRSPDPHVASTAIASALSRAPLPRGPARVVVPVVVDERGPQLPSAPPCDPGETS